MPAQTNVIKVPVVMKCTVVKDASDPPKFNIWFQQPAEVVSPTDPTAHSFMAGTAESYGDAAYTMTKVTGIRFDPSTIGFLDESGA